MLDFMDYIQLAFAEGTNWNRDNSYSSLTATAQSLLDFSTPERLRVHLSSLSTPHFATSYTLGTVGLIDGSVSYLYSTVPFDNTPSRSALIPLRKLAPGYRQVQAPVAPVGEETWTWNSILDGISVPGVTGGGTVASDGEIEQKQKDTLLHATLHLPPPTTLNALFLRRLSPTLQLSLAVCSTRGMPLSKSAPQASLLTHLSHDTGKYSNEYLFSTDNALFGWRGLWNFGPDPRTSETSSRKGKAQRPSLLSAGAEAYYSPVSSLIGMSTGLRFSTLPQAQAQAQAQAQSQSQTQTQTQSSSTHTTSPISTFPYTLTLTLTPLTGSLSTTYSLRASPNLSFSSRFGFNVYSWESEMVAGCELWRQPQKKPALGLDDVDDSDGLAWARRKLRENNPDYPPSVLNPQPPAAAPSTGNNGRDNDNDNDNDNGSKKKEEADGSVLKIRVDQSWNVRLLWEGRVKELLVSAGVGLGPGSFSSPSWANSSSSSASASASSSGPGQGSESGPGSGISGPSYWRGVGVSVLYSS